MSKSRSKIFIVKRTLCFLSMLLFLSFVPKSVYAQTDQVLVELADEMFTFGDHEGALSIYQQALKENSDNVRAHFMVGRCYLLSVDNKTLAATHFETAENLDPEVSEKLYYYMGEGYRYRDEFEKAIEHYEQYKRKVPGNQKEITKTDQKIENCRNALSVTVSEYDVKLTNIGNMINTEDDEYAPVLSADESILIFTSRREGSTGKLRDVDNLPFEDVYIARKSGDEWGSAENIGTVINTDKHDASIGLSPDGNTLYIYRGTGNGDIYESKFKDEEWSKPRAMKEINGKDSKETSICATHPKHLYFASNKEGGNGRTDLYVIEQDEKGKWSDPKNLGAMINTEFDEESPYFDPNNNVLYFSSKGHKSIGGYDIFKSEWDAETNTWGKPENLGLPINSSDDDIYFTMSWDGSKGYYSSYQEGGAGRNDIYVINFNEKEEDPIDTIVETPVDTPIVNVPEMREVKVGITIVDFDSNEPLDASIQIVEKGTSNTITSGTSTGGEFQWEFKNEEGKEYDVYCEKNGYVYKSITVFVPAMSEELQTISKTVSLKKQVENRVNVLRNIYFDFDRFSLKQESEVELTKLLNMLTENPNMKVEIAGHTDFVGPDGYNDQLSRQRASAVVKWLRNKGVESHRIEAKGYGESRPMASNDDYPELNRRTEFIIKQK